MNGPRSLPAPKVTETEFQQQVVQLATIAGWQHLHVRRTIGRGRKWTTSTNLPGWPDLLLWKPGRIVAAELKTDTGKTTPEQDAVLASLTAAGVETHVWRPADWDEIASTLGRRQ